VGDAVVQPPARSNLLWCWWQGDNAAIDAALLRGSPTTSIPPRPIGPRCPWVTSPPLSGASASSYSTSCDPGPSAGGPERGRGDESTVRAPDTAEHGPSPSGPRRRHPSRRPAAARPPPHRTSARARKIRNTARIGTTRSGGRRPVDPVPAAVGVAGPGILACCLAICRGPRGSPPNISSLTHCRCPRTLGRGRMEHTFALGSASTLAGPSSVNGAAGVAVPVGSPATSLLHVL
jgi:hypothetical protein